MPATFNFINTTKAKVPRLAFSQMKDAVLGKEYELSVAIISRNKIRELNKRWRDRDCATDILSFPLSKKSGEIYINPEETKKMAPEFDRTYANFIKFLFIHGLIHLKGYDHSSRMESIETKYRKQFGI
jgi:probable rRNA maturation factor